MNIIPIELCERNSYVKTTKLLGKAIGNGEQLEKFINFLKKAKDRNKEKLKYKNKLSFDVSTRF